MRMDLCVYVYMTNQINVKDRMYMNQDGCNPADIYTTVGPRYT